MFWNIVCPSLYLWFLYAGYHICKEEPPIYGGRSCDNDGRPITTPESEGSGLGFVVLAFIFFVTLVYSAVTDGWVDGGVVYIVCATSMGVVQINAMIFIHLRKKQKAVSGCVND